MRCEGTEEWSAGERNGRHGGKHTQIDVLENTMGQNHLFKCKKSWKIARGACATKVEVDQGKTQETKEVNKGR